IDYKTRKVAMAFVQLAQLGHQFLVGVALRPCTHDALCRVEEIRRHDAIERTLFPDPHFRLVRHADFLQLEGSAIVDVVADVLFVAQHLAHRGPRPVAAQIRPDTLRVQAFSDDGLQGALVHEPAIDAIDGGHLLVRAGHQDHAIGLQALVLTAREFTLRGARLIDQNAPQSVACWPTLPEAQFDEAALAREHLGGQFPAVLSGHCTLDALDDGGNWRTIVLELLGAVSHLNTSALADVLVVGALVRILKPAPATNVVDKDGVEVRLTRFHRLYQ